MYLYDVLYESISLYLAFQFMIENTKIIYKKF